MNRKYLLIMPAVVLAIMASNNAFASDSPWQSGIEAQWLMADAASSPKQAARKALRQNGGGKVLSVKRKNGYYAVKVIKNGKVSVISIPAE